VDKLLTPAQVAKILDVTPQTLNLWRREKTGPICHVLSPRTIRYARSDVDAWIAQTRDADRCQAC
jgi:predicted DNA-binding transcriptional regulator AlpA